MSYSEFTLIASYGVVTQANQNPGNTLARHLYLEADPSSSGTFKHFALYFFEPPQSLGYVNPNNGYVVPFLRLNDFSDIYHIVQSEKPVYTLFYADDSNQLQWFQVRTAAEPTGEGPTNFSRRRAPAIDDRARDVDPVRSSSGVNAVISFDCG
jgi:hypothetical protein